MAALPSTTQSLVDALQASLVVGATVENPLSASHRRELVAARDRAKSIRRAARVASFNGWATAVAAAASGMFLAFDHSAAAIAVTLGLCIVAHNEFRGRKLLLNFDPAGATLLGWNQVGLLAIVVVYCLWKLSGSSAEAAGALAQQLNGETEQELLRMVGDLQGLYQTVSLGLYGGAIVLSVLFQGGNAIYYFTRRRCVEDFIAETPQWVREVQSGSVPI